MYLCADISIFTGIFASLHCLRASLQRYFNLYTVREHLYTDISIFTLSEAVLTNISASSQIYLLLYNHNCKKSVGAMVRPRPQRRTPLKCFITFNLEYDETPVRFAHRARISRRPYIYFKIIWSLRLRIHKKQKRDAFSLRVGKFHRDC
jgi:hypothetical protein